MKEEEIRQRSMFNKYLDLIQSDIKNIFIHRDNFVNIKCVACGSIDYRFEFEKWGFEYVLCSDCGTLFVNPRPSFEKLIEFYKSSLSTSFWVNELFPSVIGSRRKNIFQPRAEYIEKRFHTMSSGRIGDIGAGFGLFLEELAKSWTEATLVAIEPSLEMTKICQEKNFQVLPCAIEEVSGYDGKFDLLVSFELLEHLYSPDNFLKKAWKLLMPGGHLIITTLNVEGFDIQILWDKSRSLSPPLHLNFFNTKSIGTLLEKNGFIVETVDTPGRLDWDIVEGMYLKEGNYPGRFWSLVTKQKEKVKTELQEWITSSGLSSHMRIVAKKGHSWREVLE